MTDVPTVSQLVYGPTAASTVPVGDHSLVRGLDKRDLSGRGPDAGASGEDHCTSGKAALEELLKIAPLLPVAVSENRHFALRGVTAAALGDVDQILNLGAGLPTPGGVSVNDVVRHHQPLARVVHVDGSQGVAVPDRAMLARVDNVLLVHADARDPARVLNEARELLDESKPVCIVATALLHLWRNDENPAGVLHEYMRAFPAGYLVFSHCCWDKVEPAKLARLRAIYQRYFMPIYPRTAAEIAVMLDGLDVQEPGLVEASQWRSNDRRIDVGDAYFLAAVAKFGQYVVTSARDAA